MNLFVVPSWYPSPRNPTHGIFIKEQVEMMAKLHPEWNIGVSLWGQGDPEKQIWAKDHIRNIRKVMRHHPMPETETEKGITTYSSPALSWTKRFRKGNIVEIIGCNEHNYLANKLEFGKPDLIMVQASYPGALIGAYLSKKYGVPYQVHVRMGGFMFERLLNDLGSQQEEFITTINLADHITVTSDFQADQIRKWIPKTRTIHNPVDLEFFSPNHTIDSQGYALAVGRLEQEKGFDLLIDAVAQAPQIKLKIIGDGSQKKRLQDEVKELGLADRVEFLGQQSRSSVKKWMQACQFLVLPSRYETFGNVLLEAMACGKPVVATKCGGPQEIVSENVGLLCDIDSKSLAINLNRMLGENERFSSDKIHQYVTDHFSTSRWISEIEMMLQR